MPSEKDTSKPQPPHADQATAPPAACCDGDKPEKPAPPLRTRIIPEKIRQDVFLRDNFTCKCYECLDGPQDQKVLCIHHIDGDRANHNPDNLCVMKTTCHSAYHQRLRAARRKWRGFICELDAKYPPTTQLPLPFSHVED